MISAVTTLAHPAHSGCLATYAQECVGKYSGGKHFDDMTPDEQKRFVAERDKCIATAEDAFKRGWICHEAAGAPVGNIGRSPNMNPGGFPANNPTYRDGDGKIIPPPGTHIPCGYIEEHPAKYPHSLCFAPLTPCEFVLRHNPRGAKGCPKEHDAKYWGGLSLKPTLLTPKVCAAFDRWELAHPQELNADTAETDTICGAHYRHWHPEDTR